MEMPQFIDLCILLGCDYLEPIKGVGPKSALKLIREYGTLAKVIEHLKEKYVNSLYFGFGITDLLFRVAEKEEAADEGKKKKGGVHIPDEWPFEAAKELFMKPDVTPADELEVRVLLINLKGAMILKHRIQLDWKSPDLEGLVDFLVKEKGFKCAPSPDLSYQPMY